MVPVNSSDRVLRLKQVQEKTGLARSTIYDRLNPRSARFDNSFPKPFKIGLSAVGWLESGIDEWISKRASNLIVY
ncbi:MULTISPECIES: AlpA family transcriptional regulator [Pseudomonas]|uniref:AlpA family transcriptional regulator n=1 Tax=Pseudomonas TaxID=286 RepID=UPI0009A3D3AB|nr:MULTISPECIES: AlpA family transcriptional regulator [Pseudomonas]ELP1283607.1 AlpA family transcriptional regulator [Pseudomonas aeruginosa]MBI8159114.1 AlpA family transcriptional regulator [Pseudomonas aeruginosa]MBW6368952.1 AlpA family transcriptional regulator [Pseudomonas aeruginosa]MCM1992885.1 AlpA family transcriptional regulator [Pseudomonas aeruginosa]MCM2002148.1 AlpA family transcriptional regulator [Pseudomonas aeruginosa]